MSVWRVADEALTELGERIVADCEGAATGFSVAFGELTVSALAHRIVHLLTTLRDSTAFQFQQLIDVTAADYPQREKRFDVVYHLLSMTRNRRVRIKVETDEDTQVPSIVGVYPAADWFERETFDMYGVFFEGHPDLRRLLTDYGFHGHPLRKDFPMTGYVEVRYDDELKRVVYEPVKSVEFRSWDFLSPWEGAEYARPGEGYKYTLPGDEKA
ncbi:MAG TPA: NADH-quinone oxidoreductase subunit C [Caulobacteraceae bacterium]|jgi:NADH-quinone oxidoreductase subunit C|nr:NADH-quinone oxidoreductase subunit C [Caulobacteraceae bacterium]